MLHIFKNRRLLAILILGFSSGLPLALTSSTLQAWYTVTGVNIITIGLLTLVGQPYIYKFMWAPIMDRYVPPFLDRRRGWMLITQSLLLISIIFMAFINPATHPLEMGFVALWVAFLSASQDISIDAYRTDLLEPDERGLGAALAVTGYRIAMLVSGGIALILAELIGWQLTYILMAAMFVVGMVTSLVAPTPTNRITVPSSIAAAIVDPFKDLFLRPYGVMILLFVFLYKLNYEFILAMTPTFLLRGLGYSLITVGTIHKGVGFIALLLGLFIGGFALIRIGVYRALLIFGSLQALTALGYMYLAMIAKSYSLLVIVICSDNFFVGLESATFVAFLMSLCNHRYSATQFALLSAIATCGRVFAGPIGAVMVEYGGWAHFYLMVFVIALPGLLLGLLVYRLTGQQVYGSTGLRVNGMIDD